MFARGANKSSGRRGSNHNSVVENLAKIIDGLSRDRGSRPRSVDSCREPRPERMRVPSRLASPGPRPEGPAHSDRRHPRRRVPEKAAWGHRRTSWRGKARQYAGFDLGMRLFALGPSEIVPVHLRAMARERLGRGASRSAKASTICCDVQAAVGCSVNAASSAGIRDGDGCARASAGNEREN
jgi:hypothetical protein